MFQLLLASLLVAKTLALTLCNNHPGYVTTLSQAVARSDILRSGQSRHYCFEATREYLRPSVASLYVKLATCRGTVSVRLFDPMGDEVYMKGRDCGKKRSAQGNQVQYGKNHYWPLSERKQYTVSEEHSIWTYHNTSAMLGVYTIIVHAERTHAMCGAAEFEILASSKRYRQPPVLPDDTCILHDSKFTRTNQVGLSWLAARLPANTDYQTVKYCVYMMPVSARHSHTCSDHGSRCSVAHLRDGNTKEMCFISSRRSRVWTIVRNLEPDTEYHVDVIAWTYDKVQGVYFLPMAYSQYQYISTLPG